MDDDGERIDEVFRQAYASINAIQGDDAGTPELFAKAMALHFGAVLGCTSCPGCAAIIADICNEVLTNQGSPWRLVASDEDRKRHLH